jgi:prevent-host-death family protein
MRTLSDTLLAAVVVLAKIADMKRVSASQAKNNFGGLLDDVAALGCVEIVKHGRPVAVVLSLDALEEVRGAGRADNQEGSWGQTHMIPADKARAARMVKASSDFDEE